MKIRWEIEDGYCGGSRPQYTHIDDDELEDFETEEEKKEFINECVEEDFDNKIGWIIIGTEE